jgi:hypothetical protein
LRPQTDEDQPIRLGVGEAFQVVVGWLRLLHADSSETVECIAEEFAELTPD